MYEYRCAVMRVVDGDTLHLDVDMGCDIHTLMTIRLDGIDAPELRTDEGKVAKAEAGDWIANATQLTLRTVKDRREKYGRYLGTIYRDDEAQSLNTWLLANGYARAYSGGQR